jgi:hypothetical protein
MTSRAQELKMRCASKSDAAKVDPKLMVVTKLTAIYLCLQWHEEQ